MSPEPFLMSLRDLEIMMKDAHRAYRVRVSVRFIVSGLGGNKGASFDMDEVADLIRAMSESEMSSGFELAAQSLRDRINNLYEVVSSLVSFRVLDEYDDADSWCVSTLPDPKHAVLYGVLP